jgi:hypothetical protein
MSKNQEQLKKNGRPFGGKGTSRTAMYVMINADTHYKTRVIAKDEGLSVTELVRQLIESGLRRKLSDRSDRSQLEKEAIQHLSMVVQQNLEKVNNGGQ